MNIKKKNPSRWIVLTLLLATLLAQVSCRTNCTCKAYDGTVVEYTEEELNDYGWSCSEMEDRYHSGLAYAVCDKSF